MKNIDSIKARYRSMGIKEDNIDYAISAVKDGVKRAHIVENLTADYRGMKEEETMPLLNELFAANGGEHKKENSNGYLFGGCTLAVDFWRTITSFTFTPSAASSSGPSPFGYAPSYSHSGD